MTGKLCNEPNCVKPAAARGACLYHYNKRLLAALPNCSWRSGSGEECVRRASGAGLCSMHYTRKRLGICMDSPARPSNADLKSWLESHSNYAGNDCLTWPFGRGTNGRGEVTVNGQRMTPARAMCTLAHGSPEFSGAQAAHNCGRGSDGCVNPSHLRWATPVDNAADRLAHGTDIRGEKHPAVKLTEADVLAIYRAERNAKVVAIRFGVAPTTVKSIWHGRNWGWLTGHPAAR